MFERVPPLNLQSDSSCKRWLNILYTVVQSSRGRIDRKLINLQSFTTQISLIRNSLLDHFFPERSRMPTDG